MTLKDLAEVRAAYLIPKHVAGVLGCSQYSINIAAREGELPFPVIVMGSRVRIPKRPFLEYMGYKAQQEDAACTQG